MHVEIVGKPYSVKRNAHGYSVVPLEKLTDRLHKSYQVAVTEAGFPLKCSCPDCVYRATWCKHLEAIKTLILSGKLA